jgi:hypothetical protein
MKSTVHRSGKLPRIAFAWMVLVGCSSGGGSGGTATGANGACTSISINARQCMQGLSASQYSDLQEQAKRAAATCPTCQSSNITCTNGGTCPMAASFVGKCSFPNGNVFFYYGTDTDPKGPSPEETKQNSSEYCAKQNGVWSASF